MLLNDLKRILFERLFEVLQVVGDATRRCEHVSVGDQAAAALVLPTSSGQESPDADHPRLLLDAHFQIHVGAAGVDVGMLRHAAV